LTHWYAVHTQPGAEHKAAAHLVRQGFETYLPAYRKERRHARRVEQVDAPLFPRYLFVAIDLERDRWRAVLSTLGVRQLVSFGDRPAQVPAEVIAGIRSRENAEGLVVLDRPQPFRPGEAVRITEGPMADLSALFQGITDDHRVLLLLDLLGRQVRVKVPAAAVAAWN
jgi:transcriptional antiterminator RfaH